MAAVYRHFLTPQILLRAYAKGWFPMAEGRSQTELFWVEPERRGVIPMDRFHVPRRLRRTVRQDPYRVTIDSAFDRVIRECAEPTAGREESWINDELIDLYGRMHRLGHAHSVECWQGMDLAGGLYGVSLGGVFFGESMFSRRPNASKIALVFLAARLMAGGYRLLDAQFVTDHLKQFGIQEVPRDQFLRLLEPAALLSGNFYSLPSGLAGAEILQSITQTS